MDEENKELKNKLDIGVKTIETMKTRLEDLSKKNEALTERILEINPKCGGRIGG